MRYDYILIDIDDTLFNFSVAEETALRRLFEKYGFEFNNDVLQEYRKYNLATWRDIEAGVCTTKDLPERRFKNIIDESVFETHEDYLKFSNGYIEELKECAFVYDDSEALLKALYGKCKILVVTNGVKTVQDGRLSKSGFNKYFDKVYISEVIGCQKPSKEFFDYVMNDAGIKDRDKCIILGDSLTSDMQGGRNAGITTCRIVRGTKNNEKNPLCDYEIDNLIDFLEIVK